MSADTSDPALRRAVEAVHARDSETSWLLAGYSAPGTPKLVLIDSGHNPALPALRRHLDSEAVANGDATFAYAEVQGKGLVILRLGDKINVVKRARAIVHSRTFAALFPDYLALLTINKTGQFTAELIAEQLGLDPPSLSVASPLGSRPTALPDVSNDNVTPTPTHGLTAAPAPAPSTPVNQVPKVDGRAKSLEPSPEPTQQPTPAATPPPTAPPPAPPKSAARARSIKRKPSKPAAPTDPPPASAPAPPAPPAQCDQDAGQASTPVAQEPTPAVPPASHLPTPPILATSVVPTPREPLSRNETAERLRPILPPQRIGTAEKASTSSVANPTTPLAPPTQCDNELRAEQTAIGRDALGRMNQPPPPLLSVSTKEPSDGTPVTPVSARSALTDTTYDSFTGSSMQNSPHPGSEHERNNWSETRFFARAPSRPLSPDGSSSRERLPTSQQQLPPSQAGAGPAHPDAAEVLTLSQKAPSNSATPAKSVHQPGPTDLRLPTEESMSEDTPQARTPLPAVPNEPLTAVGPAPMPPQPQFPAEVPQRSQPPPPPRRVASKPEVLPDGALPSRSSSRNGSMPSQPLVTTQRIDSPRLNGSPRLGGALDSHGKANGSSKQSPFSRLNTSNSSLSQPSGSPKQNTTPAVPPVPVSATDVPHALHHSASISSASSGRDSRSAVSPVTMFPSTMPNPLPVPSYDGAEFLADNETRGLQGSMASTGAQFDGISGLAGIGAAFAMQHDAEPSQLAQVPVRGSSRSALSGAGVSSTEQWGLETMTERPSLESGARSSTEDGRSSLGRSNSLGSTSRNRPTVTAGRLTKSPSVSSLASAAGMERRRPPGPRPMRSPSIGSENTPPMVTTRRVTSPEPVPSADSATPKPEDKQMHEIAMSDVSTRSEATEQAPSHPVVRQLSLSQSQRSTETSGVATPESGRSIGHRKTSSASRKPAPPIDHALLEALKKESVSSDLERLQRSTPPPPLAAPATAPAAATQSRKKPPPPIRIVPKKPPPPLPLTATMLNVVPAGGSPATGTDAAAISAAAAGLPSPGLLSPTMPISPRTSYNPVSPSSARHSFQSSHSHGSDSVYRSIVGSSRDSHQSQNRLSQRMSNRLSQFSARMSRRISSDGGHYRSYTEEWATSPVSVDQEHSFVGNAALARQSTARSVSLSNGRLTPIKTSAPSSTHASQSSLPLTSPAPLDADYRSARDMTGPVEGMVIITADAPSGAKEKKSKSSAKAAGALGDKEKKSEVETHAQAEQRAEQPASSETGRPLEKRENGVKRKGTAVSSAVVDLSESPQIQQPATLSPPDSVGVDHFSAVSPQFVNAPRQTLPAGVSPSLETSPTMYQQRYPETPTMTTSPQSSHDRHSLSQKLRHALRSNSNSDAGHGRPDYLPVSPPIASPPSPAVSNFSVSGNSPNPNRSSIQGSLGRAFRLRAGSNNGGKGVPKGTSPGGISSEDFKHLHDRDSLQGLGLGMAFPPNSYRTPSGGLGYTPPAKSSRPVSNISAEDALASARVKNMAEQEEAQERWRRLETERQQHRLSGLTSPGLVSNALRTQQENAAPDPPSVTLSGEDNDEGAPPPLPPKDSILEPSEAPSSSDADAGGPILPRDSLAELPSPKRKRLSSRDLGARESMQTLSSLDDRSPPRSPVPRSYTRDSIVSTVLSSESEVRYSSSEVRESKVSLEPDVRSMVSPRSSYEQSDARRPSVSRNTSFGARERTGSSLYRGGSSFEPRLSRDTVRSTGSRTSFERRGGGGTARSVSRASFEPPRTNAPSASVSASASTSGHQALPLELDAPDEQREAAEETRSERSARLRTEAAEVERLAQERAERAARKRQEAEKREAERVAAAERAAAEREKLEAERAAKRAEELARKSQQTAAVREQLASGRADGGVMLRGYLTAQGMTGPWRRRYFHLLPDQLELYKAPGESKPISTISLGSKTVIDHDVYEESQVQGAWRLRGEKGEEFFMFADSEQDRDVVMEGFKVVIGREVQ